MEVTGIEGTNHQTNKSHMHVLANLDNLMAATMAIPAVCAQLVAANKNRQLKNATDAGSTTESMETKRSTC